MKALSIQQPWAWLIVAGHKDIENRSWSTRQRGRILVHAGKRYSRRDHHEYFAPMVNECFRILLPSYEQLQRGGIVGEVEIVDCTQTSTSRWKEEGSWGFVLRGAREMTFTPMRGQLGFFEVPTMEAS